MTQPPEKFELVDKCFLKNSTSKLQCLALFAPLTLNTYSPKRHPIQTLDPPQLGLFDVEEQWFCYELFLSLNPETVQENLIINALKIATHRLWP